MNLINVASEWVKNIFVLIVAISFIEVLLPSGNMEKYVKFVFSLLILATLLSPLVYIFLE